MWRAFLISATPNAEPHSNRNSQEGEQCSPNQQNENYPHCLLFPVLKFAEIAA
jgi:hypothetical protein